MNENMYGYRCVKCNSCAFFKPAGRHPESRIDPDTVWPDACGRYGCSMRDCYPATEDCAGFMTKNDYKIYLWKKELSKKMRNKKV